MARSRHNSPAGDDADDGANALFTITGRPVYFYLYGTNEPTAPGALTEGQREHLKGLITKNGGFICKSEADADTIIVNPVQVKALKDKYDFEHNIYVEPPSFVELCIHRGVYTHDRVLKKPLGGRPPKGARTPFTDEDDQHLCEFLARRIPDKEAGGRNGRNTYIELVEKAQYAGLGYEWAARHTWESWKERYKKRFEIMDPIIDEIVRQNPPPADGKGVRPYDRRVNGQGQFALLNKQALMEEEEEEDEDVFEIETGPEHDAHEEAGESQQELPQEGDEEEDHRPGPEDAGPSGTQRTPSASPPPAPKQKQKQAAQSSRARPPPRAPNGGLAAAARLAQRALTQEAPASSQATLVGPVPSQMRGASGAAKLPPRRPREASVEREEAHAPTEKPVAKRRKIHKAPEPPVVQVPPMREGGRGSRVASQAARKTADQPRKVPSVVPAPRRQPVRPPSPVVQEEDEDEEDVDGDDDEMEDEGVVAGGSDEQDVEELLQAQSAETSRQFSPPVAGPSGASASDDMDSDDQVALQKLNPDRRASMSDEDDDDVAYANSLDLTVPSRSRNASARHATASRSPQAPVTPARPVRRGTDESTESEAAVPLAGTRASETVRRARESAKREPYLPPPGTRAAIVAAIPAPVSGKVLRSRKIPTRA
ncbi:uncharacterized protein TRAVEDRAFT_46200 [Trametes versicolor FP-101664 SS1]|uniref:uncharacterized protein n=1 Tax=Trametes versicolor (strain FP-101664) TaxID=717944 RepID=UPI0004622410|nr:uncharacterized protein TRAVEDRAFT_46200 [Trametes versicolor FP-101664 SS1]EIW60963.1 hypothetical protein TRAVEDRAFT_46200 [Trametes versicolor FP-101664 SS1]